MQMWPVARLGRYFIKIQKMKKNFLAIIITLLIMYLMTVGIMFDGDHYAAFNPYWQVKLWFFVFGWSIGYIGYVLMALLILLFFILIRWLLNKAKNS